MGIDPLFHRAAGSGFSSLISRRIAQAGKDKITTYPASFIISFSTNHRSYGRLHHRSFLSTS
jgi:hypothetical protein